MAKPIMHDPNGERYIENKKMRNAIRKEVLAKTESSMMGDVMYYYCHYCRTPMINKNVTMDHIIPRAKGGSYSVSNLIACCRTCNYRKGKMDYFDFIESK